MASGGVSVDFTSVQAHGNVRSPGRELDVAESEYLYLAEWWGQGERKWVKAIENSNSRPQEEISRAPTSSSQVSQPKTVSKVEMSAS